MAVLRCCSPMLVYAGAEQQPAQGRARAQLSDAEAAIFDCLTDPAFVSELIKFLSLEENKGKDRFHSKFFVLFKVTSSCLDLIHSYALYFSFLFSYSNYSRIQKISVFEKSLLDELTSAACISFYRAYL